MIVTEPPDRWQSRTARVSSASLSLVEVVRDKSLVWALCELDVPVSPSHLAVAHAATLVQALK